MREKFENLCDWWEDIKNELSRYWTIAKLALLQEKATKDSKVKGMNEHEKEFLPAVLEVTEMPPSHVYSADFVVNLRQNRHYRYLGRKTDACLKHQDHSNPDRQRD